MDPNLNTFLEPHPSLTYRRGQNLKDRLVHSHYSPPVRGDTWLNREIKGCFSKFIKSGPTFSSSVTNKVFHIRQFINSKSTGVIYKAHCSCGKDYVGKTTRELRGRVGEHLGDIRHQRDTAISRHKWTHHQGNIEHLYFQGIELVRPSVRKGDLNRIILQKECFWIFKLHCVEPEGLNEQLNFNCFI